MAIPPVGRDAIERALEEFDSKLRPTDEWSRWDASKAQVWSLALQSTGRNT
jgi:hypothetical protein